MDQRQNQLTQWLEDCLPSANGPIQIRSVSGDASFRRYFRVHQANQTWIAMDAPPDRETTGPFVAIARHWRQQGINTPEIIALSRKQGLLLMSDFGDIQYLDKLSDANADHLYEQAMTSLRRIQTQTSPPDYPLPPYNRKLLLSEMALFRDWLTVRKLGIALTLDESRMLDNTFQLLAENALAQPQVCVHRDYHSRNLMIDGDSPGILDFQDAVWGPVTYDLVSLLRDCYIQWPVDRVRCWALEFLQTADGGDPLDRIGSDEFLRWFDLMGIQRHLKAAGIFARLSLRDQKHGYLQDIPRTVDYLHTVSQDYPELRPFGHWLASRFLPALTAANAGAA